MVYQILLIITIEKVWRTVWRVYILILWSKGLNLGELVTVCMSHQMAPNKTLLLFFTLRKVCFKIVVMSN